mmetsp:Transcript_17842/g.33175  ORF Transcript_17842/g.33175 Transcript_17842/m.33175 type:complete len:107 (-) Transcript_17842:1645-1965(-)
MRRRVEARAHLFFRRKVLELLFAGGGRFPTVAGGCTGVQSAEAEGGPQELKSLVSSDRRSLYCSTRKTTAAVMLTIGCTTKETKSGQLRRKKGPFIEVSQLHFQEI